jgi:SPP1 family predicted phage head-tail adaptor
MRAGKMDRRVTIQSNTTSRNSYGEETDSWSTLATVWAEVRHLRGDEKFLAKAVTTEKVITVRIRYRSDVTTQNRLVWESNNYDITEVAEIGRREGLEITAERIGDD